jgi:hypothetical protein
MVALAVSKGYSVTLEEALERLARAVVAERAIENVQAGEPAAIVVETQKGIVGLEFGSGY